MSLLSFISRVVERRPERRAVPVDSLPFWRLWMASEELPTIVAAHRLGVFRLLAKSGLTEREITKALRVSPRAARVLLKQLVSLGWIEQDKSRYSYGLTRACRAGKWKSLLKANALTPQEYLLALTRNRPIKGRVRGDRSLHFPMLFAAVEIGLTKLLGERKLTFESLVQTAEVPARYLKEILECLHGYKLVARDSRGNWALSETGRTYLLEESPYNVHGTLNLMSLNPATASSLYDVVVKERDRADDGKMMEHVMSLETARLFAKHMHSQGAAAAVAVSHEPFFGRVKSVLDVAGGGGTYGQAAVRQNPQLTATVLELSPMDNVAREQVRLERLSSRVQVATGNMFHLSDWPKTRQDVVFFSHVFHDWGPEKILLLLRNAFSILPVGGHVVLHEILADTNGIKREIANAFSVTLFKWTEGRQYRSEELLRLLQVAGFLPEVSAFPVHGPSSLIIARK